MSYPFPGPGGTDDSPYSSNTIHNNPPPFKATGFGLWNKYPNLAADEYNSNGIMINMAAQKGTNSHLRKHYLFVTAVETSWTLNGDYGQSVDARSFYPRNLIQNELKIEGICANQYEFDKLTEFVSNHHYRALSQELRGDWINGNNLNFKLLPFYYDTNDPTQVNFGRQNHRIPKGIPIRYVYEPMHLGLVVTDFQAGHERFRQSPTWVLTCKVINDYLQKAYTQSKEFKEILTRYDKNLNKQYEQSFGPVFSESDYWSGGGGGIPRPA